MKRKLVALLLVMAVCTNSAATAFAAKSYTGEEIWLEETNVKSISGYAVINEETNISNKSGNAVTLPGDFNWLDRWQKTWKGSI